jgi:hypothetical protein
MDITFSFSVDTEESSPSGAADSLESLEVGETPTDRQFAVWVASLDHVDILETVRFRPSLQHRCKSCGTENHGQVLDESKILLPFPAGPFRGRVDLASNIYPKRSWGGGFYSTRTGPRSGESDNRRYASYTKYMIRQDIVRSGLFTQDQLRGAGGSKILTRHDLEVAKFAFDLVRPETCITCRNIPLSGLSAHWAVLYGRHNRHIPAQTGMLPTVQTVDDLHSLGNTIRTGFRIRSKAARLRRRYRSVKTQYCLREECLLDASLAIPVRLLYKPCGTDLRCNRVRGPRNKWRKRQIFTQWSKMVARKTTPICAQINERPWPHHKKYWYFYRKRGMFYTSEHHPYGDEDYHGS